MAEIHNAEEDDKGKLTVVKNKDRRENKDEEGKKKNDKKEDGEGKKGNVCVHYLAR